MKKLQASEPHQIVTLADGEEVFISESLEVIQGHKFMRITPSIVMSTITTRNHNGLRHDMLYFWHKTGRKKHSPYCYLGDLTLASGKMLGSAVAFGLTFSKDCLSQKNKRKALRCQGKLAGELAICSETGNVMNHFHTQRAGFIASTTLH